MMKPFKQISLALLISSSLLCSSLVLAADPEPASAPTPPVDTSKIVEAINALGKRIEAISVAGMKAINNAAYQIDQSLPATMQINGQKNIINTQVTQQTYNQTENSIKKTLQEISDSALTYSMVTPDVQQALDRMGKRTNLINDLTINTPASDTLYSDLLNIGSTSIFTSGASVSKPPVLHDNYFNFSSLISPLVYTSDQQLAAKNFIEYMTKRYESLTGNIEFNTLRANLDKLKSKPKELAQALHNFMDTAAFKKYQLSIRSMLASQSVAMNNFYHIANERTPIYSQNENRNLADISKALGVTPQQVRITDPNNPNLKITVWAYASPLQIENYMANHRINSSQWYQQMSAASPATVQRETLYVLAEIQSQLHQAHLDQERLLATMTAMQVQSGATNQMMLGTQANDMNEAIKAVGNPGGPKAPGVEMNDQMKKQLNATGVDPSKLPNPAPAEKK